MDVVSPSHRISACFYIPDEVALELMHKHSVPFEARRHYPEMLCAGDFVHQNEQQVRHRHDISILVSSE